MVRSCAPGGLDVTKFVPNSAQPRHEHRSTLRKMQFSPRLHPFLLEQIWALDDGRCSVAEIWRGVTREAGAVGLAGPGYHTVRAVVRSRATEARRAKRGPADGPQGGNALHAGRFAGHRSPRCGAPSASAGSAAPRGGWTGACNARLHHPDHRVEAPIGGATEFVLIQHKALARSLQSGRFVGSGM